MLLKGPRYIQLYPTLRCNQRCSFCFNRGLQASADCELSFKDAMSLIERLAAQGIGEIDIMGGEPFLLDWMADFIGRACRAGMSVNVSTNGSTPEKIGGLKGGLEGLNLGISLEGSSEEQHWGVTGHANFGAAVKSLMMLHEAGFDPLVKTVVNRHTMEDISRIADLAAGLGISRYFLIHMDLMTKDPSLAEAALDYPEFLTFYEDIRRAFEPLKVNKVNASCFEKWGLPEGVRCAGGSRKLSVLPDGSVFPCNLMFHFPGFRLGNIFSDDIEDIMADPRLDIFRKSDGKGCEIKGCSNRDNCTGGCPAHNLYHRGNTNGPDIRCEGSEKHMSASDQGYVKIYL